MRILQVVHGLPPELVGGTERYADAVARALARRGHEVAALAGTVEWKGAFGLLREERDGLRVIRLHRGDPYFDDWDKSYHPEASRLFEEVLREVSPLVVHVHHWIRLSRNLVQLAAARGIPSVVTVHDTWTTCLRCFRVFPDGKFCEEPARDEVCVPCVDRAPWQDDREIAEAFRLFRKDILAELGAATHVLFPTETHRAFVSSKGGFPGGNFRVLPHPDLAGLKCSPEPPAGGPLLLLAWGHHHPAKGTHLLLEALARPEVASAVRLELFGDSVFPDYAERLRALAAGLPVRFRGAFRREELEAVPAHLAVLPTLCHESHSFVLDEAFALGLPCLVPDRGASAVRVGEAGFLFRAGDAGDLGQWLLALSRDRSRLARARAAARARRPLPSIDEHASALAAIYEEALRMGPRQGTAGPTLEERLGFESLRSENRLRRLLFAERHVSEAASLRDQVRLAQERIARLEGGSTAGPPG